MMTLNPALTASLTKGASLTPLGVVGRGGIAEPGGFEALLALELPGGAATLSDPSSEAVTAGLDDLQSLTGGNLALPGPGKDLPVASIAMPGRDPGNAKEIAKMALEQSPLPAAGLRRLLQLPQSRPDPQAGKDGMLATSVAAERKTPASSNLVALTNVSLVIAAPIQAPLAQPTTVPTPLTPRQNLALISEAAKSITAPVIQPPVRSATPLAASPNSPLQVPASMPVTLSVDIAPPQDDGPQVTAPAIKPQARLNPSTPSNGSLADSAASTSPASAAANATIDLLKPVPAARVSPAPALAMASPLDAGITASTAPSGSNAPAVTVTHKPIDPGAVVEALIRARGEPVGPVALSVEHHLFGAVSMQFEASDRGLNVALGNAHPDFQQAVIAGIATIAATSDNQANPRHASDGSSPRHIPIQSAQPGAERADSGSEQRSHTGQQSAPVDPRRPATRFETAENSAADRPQPARSQRRGNVLA